MPFNLNLLFLRLLRHYSAKGKSSPRPRVGESRTGADGGGGSGSGGRREVGAGVGGGGIGGGGVGNARVGSSWVARYNGLSTVSNRDGGAGGGGGGGGGLHAGQVADLRVCVLRARDEGQSKVAAGDATAQSELFSRVLSANDSPSGSPTTRWDVRLSWQGRWFICLS